MVDRRLIGLVAALTLTWVVGCRPLQRRPSDQEVVAAVEKSPPAPPTIGPTYLAQVEAVKVEEHGRYNSDGNYWPARVRVKGAVKIKPTSPFQLGVVRDHSKEPESPVDFLVDARFTRDDFGHWRVWYDYDPHGPRWRLSEPGAIRRSSSGLEFLRRNDPAARPTLGSAVTPGGATNEVRR
jgi:hypothetical protein